MKKLCLLLLVAAALGSCKKDSEPAPAATTKTDLLVAKNWRLSAQTATFTALGTTNSRDEYATYSSCQRDNFIKFNTNKTLIADEGPTKCNTSDPQTQNGTWDITSDYTKLTLVDPSQGSIPVQFDVVELTATTMRLRNTIVTTVTGVSATSVNDLTFTSF